jgi:hypothetical protein
LQEARSEAGAEGGPAMKRPFTWRRGAAGTLTANTSLKTTAVVAISALSGAVGLGVGSTLGAVRFRDELLITVKAQMREELGGYVSRVEWLEWREAEIRRQEAQYRSLLAEIRRLR